MGSLRWLWQRVHNSVEFLINWLLAEPVPAFLVSILIIGAHLLIPDTGSFLYLPSEFWANFVRDVGIAILVSVFVAVAVEKAHEEKRNEQFSAHLLVLSKRDEESRKYVEAAAKSAFNAIFQLNVPENWFRDFVDMAKGSDGLIRFYQHTTIIVDCQDEVGIDQLAPDFIFYRVESNYTIKNCSSIKADYHYQAFIERQEENPELDKMVKIESVIIDGIAVESIGDDVKEHGHLKRFLKTVSFDPGQERKFEICYLGIKRVRDTLIWWPTISCNGITYWIRHSPRMAVFARSYHPSLGVDRMYSSADKGPIHIHIDKPVMARTPVEVNWHLKAKPAAEVPTAIAAE